MLGLGENVVRKRIVRVSVFSILYLLALVWLVFILHIFNHFIQLSPQDLFIATVLTICAFTVGGLIGLIRYFKRKKSK